MEITFWDPQGSILGPPIFNIFFLLSYIANYVNDTTHFLPCGDSDDLLAPLEEDL